MKFVLYVKKYLYMFSLMHSIYLGTCVHYPKQEQGGSIQLHSIYPGYFLEVLLITLYILLRLLLILSHFYYFGQNGQQSVPRLLQQRHVSLADATQQPISSPHAIT